jgi:hypothetical protein
MSEMCNCDNYSTPHAPQPKCLRTKPTEEIKTDETTQPDSASPAPTGQESETKQPDLQTPATHTEAEMTTEEPTFGGMALDEIKALPTTPAPKREKMPGTVSPTNDWRSVIKIHPAADLFPMMTPAGWLS